MQSFYRGISYIFYPGSMAVLGLGFAHAKTPIAPSVWVFFFSGFVVLPLISLALFIKLGKVSDTFVFKREQRHGLYVLGIIFSATAAFFIFRENALAAMIWSICNTAVLTFLYILNYTGCKVSAHMAGAAGLLGWILCINATELAIISAILLIVMIYAARKGLSAHSHFELILGFCLGLFVTFALACLLLTYYGISCSFI